MSNSSNYQVRILEVKVIVVVILILVILYSVIEVAASTQAQNNSPWSLPERIPSFSDSGVSPYLIADQQGKVHAFNFESPDGQISLLMYRQWTRSRSWSSPVNILHLSSGGAPILRGVLLDDEGVIHVIYNDSSLEGRALFYTSAHVSEANLATAWVEPVLVGMDTDRALAAAFSGDGKGRLIVVYGGEYFGAGLYAVYSIDGGKSWSQPVLLSRSYMTDLWPASIELEMDEQGRLHVVWYTADLAGTGHEIRYGRLSPSFMDWENEIVITSLDQPSDMLGWPSIIGSGTELIMAYQDGFPPTRWIRRSLNAGETWSNPIRPFQHQGAYANVVLVKDSLERAHMVLGNRLNNPDTHGMWYSQLVGDRWLPLAPIVSGPDTDTFDPCCPQAVVSQGNVLLATWTNDVGREHRTGAWYSFTTLDAPELPVEFSPSSTVMIETPTASLISQIETQVPPTRNPPQYSRSNGVFDLFQGNNPNIPMLIGIFPVILLVVGALVIHNTRRR